MTQSGGQGAGIQLQVGLDLAFFRQQMQKVSTIAASEFTARLDVRFNRQLLDAELNNLQRAIKRRVYSVEIGGNLGELPAQIKNLRDQLASLENTKIEVGVGAVQSLSQRDARRIKSGLRAAVLDGSKKILIPTTIIPSITQKDVREFKSAVKEKLSGISVDVKVNAKGKGFAESPQGAVGLMQYMQSQGLLGKTASGMTMRMGQGGGDIGQQLNDAVQSASKIKSIFDGVAKSIATSGKLTANVQGKRLGLSNVPLMTGSLEKRVGRSASSIEGTLSSEALKLLYPEINKAISSFAALRGQVQRNTSKLSGFGLIIGLAAFAGVPLAKSIVKLTGSANNFAELLDRLGPKLESAFLKAASSILSASSGRLLRGGSVAGLLPAAYRGIGPAAEPAGLLPPAYRGIGPSRNAGALPPGRPQAMLPGTSFGEQKYLPTALGEELKKILRDAANAFIDALKTQIRSTKVLDLGRTMQPTLSGSARIAGLLSPEPPGRYRASRANEDQSALFARREREARMRSALRETRVLSQRGGTLPGTTFMGDDFTAGGGRDRVTGRGQPSQRGGAIIPYAPSTKLPSDYIEAVKKYSQVINLGKAATDSFRASQIPFIGGLKNLAGEFGEATKQVLLYGTAYKGLAFVTSLPGQILNAAKGQQQFNNAMQVATQTSGTYAKELLFVDNVQRAFGLDLETTRTGFTRLYASMSPAGFDSGSIEKLFVGISSAMAALQLTPDKAERVIYAFGQMASKGQVMSEELKGQLGDVLPGALSIFASAAGKSIKDFNKELEAGVYSGSKFRELMTKVTEELTARFGSGASAAGLSMQVLINIVKGDFTRTLESFAPLANSAAEAILKPLGGALRQLSTAAKLATGERGRKAGQITKQEQIVEELGSVAAGRVGPNEARALEQYKGAKQSLAALNIELENFNELAKDPAIAQQARDIQAFTEEIGKAANFVKNFASSIGSALSPVLSFLGTNLTTVIAGVSLLGITLQGTRLALLAVAGATAIVKGALAVIGFLGLVKTLGSFNAALVTHGTITKTVAGIYTALGIQATAAANGIVLASGATIGFKAAIIGLMASTGLGLFVALVGTIGGAFLTMGDNAKKGAEDAKQAAKDMAEAARTGNVPQLEASLRQASAEVQLMKDAQAIVRQQSSQKQGIYGATGARTLTSRQLSEEDKAVLDAAGISLPDQGATEKELLKQLNDALAIKQGVLRKGKSQLKTAERQRARTGEGIPSLGLGNTGAEEDSKAAQRGSALLNAIEQREEAIANARREREEKIAQIRADAIEGVAKIERSLADERQKLEREIAQINRRRIDESEDIERQIRIARGEDRGLVEAEQKVVDIFREGRDERLALSERIANEEKEQARNIADFQKKIAKELREADQAHTKKIGDIQRNYAKQVAKLIEEGTGRAAKRMTTAAELFSTYIQRAGAFSPTTGAPYPQPMSSMGTKPVYENPKEVPGSVQKLDKQILELQDKLRKQIISGKGLGLGDQLAKLLGSQGGFEDVAGLKPLPVARMINQAARPFQQLWRQIGDAADSVYSYTKKEQKAILKPDAARREQVLRRIQRSEQVRQDWNPLASESRSRLNQTNPNPRSKPSSMELSGFNSMLQQMQGTLLRETLSRMSWSGGAVKGDLSTYLNENQLRMIRSGVSDLVEKYGPEFLERLVGGSFKAAIRGAAELEKIRVKPRAGASSAPLESMGGDEEWLKRFMEQSEPPRIVPGIQNRIEGAFLPGGSFDVSKVANDFGTIAAASILRGILENPVTSMALGRGQVAQAQGSYRIGDRVGYMPESQRLYGVSGAAQTTQLRQTLQQTGDVASSEKEVDRLKLAFADVTKDSAAYIKDIEKQTKLLREQAKFVRAGVSQSMSRELAEFAMRREEETLELTRSAQQAIREKKLPSEQIIALLDTEIQQVEALYAGQVQVTFELEKQRNLLEMISESPQVALNNALRETQKNFNALTNSGNIAVGVASSIGDAFGDAFKGIITGSMTAREALAGFFQGLADSFADMVSKMIAEYMKMALIKGIMSLLPGLGGMGSGLSDLSVPASISNPLGDLTGIGAAYANGGIAPGGFQAFANGGIVTGPTLGLVGEGRYNEAVIPLPDGKSVPVDLGGAMGGQITSNIVVNVSSDGKTSSTSSGADAAGFGRKLEGAVKQVIATELRPGGLLATRR